MFASKIGKTAIVAMWLALTTSAMAGSGSQKGSTNDGNLVYLDEFPRSQTFSSQRHAVTADGEILICQVGLTAQDGKCYDGKNANAWQHLAASAPAGYRVAAYQWVLPSSSSGTVYRWLIVYYSKVK